MDEVGVCFWPVESLICWVFLCKSEQNNTKAQRITFDNICTSCLPPREDLCGDTSLTAGMSKSFCINSSFGKDCCHARAQPFPVPLLLRTKAAMIIWRSLLCLPCIQNDSEAEIMLLLCHQLLARAIRIPENAKTITPISIHAVKILFGQSSGVMAVSTPLRSLYTGSWLWCYLMHFVVHLSD